MDKERSRPAGVVSPDAPMHLRAILTIVNFAVVAIALAIFFLLPSLATIAVYAVLIWMFSSLFIFYHPFGSRASRPIGPSVGTGAGATATGGASSGPPLPSSGIGFCIYCGTHLAVGTTTCPACGRAVRYA